MKIISSKNIPQEALSKLINYGVVLPFETEGVTYSSISNHPDIFMCLVDNELVIAPNTPIKIKKLLSDNNTNFTEGWSAVGANYPNTAAYNAVITENNIIHNSKITDKRILDLCADKQTIHVNQAYTRCNLLPLKDDNFITSDKGIYDTLSSKKKNVLLVKPQGIILPGFDYGFFGGACGIFEDSVFFVGSLDMFYDGENVAEFLTALDYKIIELYNGQLFDCGSLFILA